MTLSSAHDKLLAVDIDRLPPPLRAALLNQPLFSIPLKAAGDGFEPAQWPAALPAEAPEDLFGKLGIKSWRDGGSLRPIFRGMPLQPVVERMLSQPTAAQRMVARAWLDSGTPLKLHLFAYRDFSQISEVRWQVDARGVAFVSACQRGVSGGKLGAAMPRMRALAKQVGDALPPTAHIVEFACLPDGDVRLVEINPGLELPELRLLTAA
jgi:hypothetical protein